MYYTRQAASTGLYAHKRSGAKVEPGRLFIVLEGTWLVCPPVRRVDTWEIPLAAASSQLHDQAGTVTGAAKG